MTIQINSEIREKMGKLAMVHVVLTFISAGVLAFFFFSRRLAGVFTFEVIVALNILAVVLLLIYSKRGKFP